VYQTLRRLLLWRQGVPARIGAVVLLVALSFTACVVARAHVTPPKSDDSPGIEEVLEDMPTWVRTAHPPREARTTTEVFTENDEFRFHTDHEIVLRDSDHLAKLIQEGDVTGDEIGEYVLGVGAGVYAYSPPSITRLRQAREVRVTLFGEGSLIPYEGGSYKRFALFLTAIPEVNGSHLYDALVDQHTIELQAKPLKISGISQGVPVRQDPNLAVFEGSPAEITVTLFNPRPIADDDEADDDGPVENLATNVPTDQLAGIEGYYTDLALVVPWLMLLLAGRTSREPVFRHVKIGVAGFVLLGLLLEFLPWFLLYKTELDFVIDAAASLVLVSAPILGVAWLRKFRKVSAWRRRDMIVLALFVTAVLTVTVTMQSGPDVGFKLTVLAVAVLVASGSAGFVGAVLIRPRTSGTQHPRVRLAWRRHRLRTAMVVSMVGAATASGAVGMTFARSFFVVDSMWLVPWWGLATIGLLWSPIAVALVKTSGVLGTRYAFWMCVAVGGSALLILPPTIVLTGPNPKNGSVRFYISLHILEHTAMIAASIALLIVLLLLLHRVSSARAIAGNSARLAAVALVAIAAVPADKRQVELSIWGAAAAFAAWVFFSAIIPVRSADLGFRLARVSAQAHTRLIRAEIWRRLARTAADVHHRGLRAKLASGEIELDVARRTQEQLDESQPPVRLHGISLEQAALGSGAGFSPWSNAAAAALAAAAISVPFVVYQLYPVVVSYTWTEMDTIDILDLVRRLSAWILYGGVFGYLYPRIRGVSPIGKSLHLIFAILPVELFQLIERTDSVMSRGFLIAAGIVAGQSVAFALALGLYWEYRLARAAGVSWNRLRNFRNLAALVSPVSAVVIAVATAIATVMASAAASALLQQDPSPPETGVPPSPPAATSTRN
jgi:hypothetical protein